MDKRINLKVKAKVFTLDIQALRGSPVHISYLQKDTFMIRLELPLTYLSYVMIFHSPVTT